MNTFFSVSNLSVNVGDKEILKNLNLNIKEKETHVIMGPNGSGKSTFSNVIMGNPKYEIKSGEIIFCDDSLRKLEADERAKKGIFMAFQHPNEISGITVEEFIRTSYLTISKAQIKDFKSPSVFKFRKLLKEKMDLLKIDYKFIERQLNKNFSGGEKKKMEMLQMLILNPKLIILDETDSGLDIDAIKVVFDAVQLMKKNGGTTLIITHYKKVLEYVEPDKIHVMMDGSIVKSGNIEIVEQVEKKGYEIFSDE